MAIPHSIPGSQTAFYQIKVEGIIRGDWSDWLNGIEISTCTKSSSPKITILTGLVTDQAALRGILCRLWDLNLTILSVHRLEQNTIEKEGNNE